MAFYKLIFRFLFSFILLLSVSLKAESAQQKTFEELPAVHYAGVSFLGNYSYIKKNYPVAVELNAATKTTPVGKLDTEFNALIEKKTLQYLTLKKKMADLRSGQRLAMALAIDHEAISHEIIGETNKIIAEVSGQLLFFDFSTMTLLANYPVAMAKNHVSGIDVDLKAASFKLLREVYLGTMNHHGILDLAAERLSSVNLSDKSELRFKVANVDLSEIVTGVMPKELTDQRFEQYLGQYLSAQLATRHQIAVLPFVKGYAIGNRMAGRFSNGEIYNLTLPAADYSFDLSLTNLKQQPFNGDDLLFAVQMGIVLRDPMLEKNDINGLFHYAVPKLVARSQSKIDAWSAYVDVMEVLLDEIVEQLGNPDRNWQQSHGGDNNSYRQFKKMKGLFNEK